MRAIICLLYYTSVVVCTSTEPQVYEDSNETYIGSIRNVRHPKKDPIAASPPAFDYRRAQQQDPQRLRYFHQQQVDEENRLKNSTSRSSRVRRERVASGPQKINSSPQIRADRKGVVLVPAENVKALQNTEFGSKIIKPLLPTTQYAKRLKSNTYQVEEVSDLETQGTESVKRKDLLGDIRPVYLNPELLKRMTMSESQRKPEDELKALNDLLGKNPTVQLQGLNQLLSSLSISKALSAIVQEPQPFQTIAPDMKPVTEGSDEPAQAMLQNLGLEQKGIYPVSPTPESLAQIQLQLDATANAHAHKVLEEAQRQAQAHVEQQHKAIAAAQEKARKAAMEKIRKHNEAIFREQGKKKPPSKEEPTQEAAESRVQAYHHVQQDLPHAEALQAGTEFFLQPNDGVTYVHAEPVSVAAEEEESHVQEHRLEDEALPLPVPSAETYEHHVVNDPHELQKITEESIKAYGGEEEDLQYASKYAFGYRIRDYHSGSDFGHEEKREGKMTKGHYHVLLPDGRLQNVNYWADPSGYHAQVTYDNFAHHS